MSHLQVELSHVAIGQYGEALVREMLSSVAPVEDGPSDMRWMGCDIEVKTARPSNYNGMGTLGYQFFLRGKRRHKTDYRKADVLVLIGLDCEGQPALCYVLPVEMLRDDRRILKIPLTGSARLAEYRDAWELLARYVAMDDVGSEPCSEKAGPSGTMGLPI